MKFKSIKRGLLTASLSLASLAVALPANAYITASIKPLQLITQELAQGVAEVKLAIPANKSPHTYELTPSDANQIAKSELLIYVGENIETKLSKLVESKKFSKLNKLELSEVDDIEDNLKKNNNKELIVGKKKADHKHKKHDHDHDGPDHHDHDHDHDHDHHHHGKYNSHIWVGNKLVLETANAISKKLIKLYPTHKSLIKTNLDKFKQSLATTNQDIKTKLANLNNKSFVVYHNALQYFEKDYNLNNSGAINQGLTANVSPRHLAELERKIKQKNIKCVLIEPQFDASKVSKLFKDLGLNIGVVDPLGSGLAQNASYSDYLQSLATSYLNCLK